MRVLLVEDDPLIAFIITEYLNNIGDIEVIGPIKKEEKIIAELERGGVDLILLDLFLSEKSGLEILRDLRKKNYLIDVIIISAENRRGKVKEVFDYGASDYIIKPFTFEKFAEVIYKYKYKLKKSVK